MAKHQQIHSAKKRLALAIKASRKRQQRRSHAGIASYNAEPTSSTRSSLSVEERKQLRRLAEVLPRSSAAARGRLDEMALVTDAAKYIRQLTATVMARVQNGSLSVEALNFVRMSQHPQSAPQVTKSGGRS
ncbi:Protein Y65A5A.1 [Aphelenchoides avenae]|nr:Protein Y65A5A.1 [Aphelenchus avenae]